MRQIEALPKQKRDALKRHLFEANEAVFQEFFANLRKKLDRVVKRITILPLFGQANTFSSIKEALHFVGEFTLERAAGSFQKYEVSVVFSNHDEIKGVFTSKERVQEFLEYVSA